MKPKVLDLFSGIGGFALAFESAGFETIGFSEIEPFPCKILAQNFPTVPNLGDVRSIDGKDFFGKVAVVCGGFPCQDISTLGHKAGLSGERSGLWFEMLRIIRGARPAFCLLENVPALRTRGYDEIQANLEEIGYSVRPFVVGALQAGFPHTRSRVWVVAYANKSYGREAELGTIKNREVKKLTGCDGSGVCVWSPRSAPAGSTNGLPNAVDRVAALGNAVVPAVVYPFAKWMRGFFP